LNPRVCHLFDGVQYILHAGDVGDDRVLDDLETIAPVTAVTGNVDGAPTARRPLKWTGTIGGLSLAMTHGHLLDPADYNASAVEMFRDASPRIIIHGHSHIAKHETLGDVAIINPGAACRPRFRDLPSVAVLEIAPGGDFFCRFVKLIP
jgi:putative phosphoesterase